MKKTFALGFLWIMLAATVNAYEIKPGAVKQRICSELNEIQVVQMDDLDLPLGEEFAIFLNGKIILKTGGEEGVDDFRFHQLPLPDVILHINQGVRPFDEVFVFMQRMWGNACDGGAIWFLGVKSGGSYAISDPIDYCGGPPPILTVMENKVIVTDPGHPHNHGTGWIPEEKWVYEDGMVHRVKEKTK
jgi:hypothetical protein